MLDSPRDEREFAVQIVDILGPDAASAEHLASRVAQFSAEPSGEPEYSVFGEREHETLAKQVGSDRSPRRLDACRRAADKKRSGEHAQSLPTVAPIHQVSVFSESLDKQMFDGRSSPMIPVDGRIAIGENALQCDSGARQPKTTTRKAGEVDDEACGGVDAMEAQPFVHRDDVPAGGQVGEDEARLSEKGADEFEAVHAEGLEYAECREIADVDRGSVHVALRIHRDVHTNHHSFVGDELESVIWAGLLPWRQNKAAPRFGRNLDVEVFVQEFADREGIFRVDRVRQDAGLRHDASLRGPQAGAGVRRAG